MDIRKTSNALAETPELAEEKITVHAEPSNSILAEGIAASQDRAEPYTPDPFSAILSEPQQTTEASLEFLIGLAGKLTQGDHNEQIGQLSEMLDALKQEKSNLMEELQRDSSEAVRSSSPDDDP